MLRSTNNPDVIDLLITTQRALWKQNARELDQFIDLLNHSHRETPKGHEGGSLLRAVAWTAGLAGIFGLDPRGR
jgi:hypothetical protein